MIAIVNSKFLLLVLPVKLFFHLIPYQKNMIANSCNIFFILLILSDNLLSASSP